MLSAPQQTGKGSVLMLQAYMRIKLLTDYAEATCYASLKRTLRTMAST